MSACRKRYSRSCEISELRSYKLNGVSQKVLLEGKLRTNPIILFLHGGPGSPVPFCAGCRGLFPEVTDVFTMAFWDQLGCGINDAVIDDSFTIDSFVAMTVDLIRALHRDFPDCSINLFGVSWGSVLAAEAARQLPELIHRVLVYGQVTKKLFFNDEVYGQLKGAPLSAKERALLERIWKKPVHSKEDIGELAKLIRKYTEGYQAKNGGKLPMARMIGGILTSPDYTFRDFKAMMVNGTLKNHSLYDELLALELTDTLREVRVPYLILQGSTDIVTSSKYVQELVSDAANPNLRLLSVADSGHIPGAKGMDAVFGQGFTFLGTA